MAKMKRLDLPLSGRSFRRLLLFSCVTMLPVLGIYLLLGGNRALQLVVDGIDVVWLRIRFRHGHFPDNRQATLSELICSPRDLPVLHDELARGNGLHMPSAVLFHQFHHLIAHVSETMNGLVCPNCDLGRQFDSGISIEMKSG